MINLSKKLYNSNISESVHLKDVYLVNFGVRHSDNSQLLLAERCPFNDALNTFYLRVYGVEDMVKGDSNSERENPLPPYELLFPINSKGSFI